MANTPRPVNGTCFTSVTTLYSAFSGSASQAMINSMDFTNPTTADIQISVWKESVAGVPLYIAPPGMNVPAMGQQSYRGIIVLISGEKIRWSGSTFGVQSVGGAMES